MDKKSSLPKRKHIHLTHYDYSNTNAVYFVTICSYNKLPFFQTPETAKMIIDDIDFRTYTVPEVRVHAFCLMPDHLHMLLQLREEYKKSLQNWVAAFKRYTARSVNLIYHIKPLWQENFYEHVLRKEESLNKIAEYIVNNPVRRKMVNEWHEYPYSKIGFDKERVVCR